MNAVVKLPMPDEDELRKFVGIVFAKADPDSYINIRAFSGGKDEKPFEHKLWSSVRIVDGMDAITEKAMVLAGRCALATSAKPVFCPPVATFKDAGGAGEENLANGIALVIECDRHPRQSLETIERLIGSATIVVASGGVWRDGEEEEDKLHAYWVLDEPTRTADEHAQLKHARELACRLADSDTSAGPPSHPLRWPGSLHLKAQRRLAHISGGDYTRVVRLADILPVLADAAGCYDVGGAATMGKLMAPLAWVEAAIAKIPNDEVDWDRWNTIGMAIFGATSGTEAGETLFLEWSKRAPTKFHNGATRARWAHFHRSPPQRIGAGTLFYLARQRDPDWLPAPEEITKLNRDYALIIVGSKALVLREDGADFDLLLPSAFKVWFANQGITDAKGKRKGLADCWLKHPQRRQYKRLVFAPSGAPPDHYNLWRGFAVEAAPGDCSRFLAHLRDNICQGDDALFRWVEAWLADVVQHPEQKPGTALVMRGKQGVGKSKVAEVVGSLLGRHYVVASGERFVTGQFNAHQASCLLLFCDEAFWAGDRKSEGKLKDLITGERHFIEYKGVDPIPVRNYLRVLVAGNQDWLIPAAFEERRFAVLDVSDQHIQDFPYFAAIEKEMKNGGREALLHHLLSLDISSVNLREIPKTEALFEQKLASMSPEQAWWLDLLCRGELPGDSRGIGCCQTGSLFNDYLKHTQRRGIQRRSAETQLGSFLRRAVPGGGPNRSRQAVAKGRGYFYKFPPLSKCREHFDAEFGQGFAWSAGKREDWGANKREVVAEGWPT